MEDDSDYAFSLQVEEALSASLLDGGAITAAAASPNNASIPYDAALGAEFSKDIQDDHLYDYERLLLDHYQAEAETKRLQVDLSRQIHDRAFACEILNVPATQWDETGDFISKPFGEGASSSSGGQGLGCRVYAKGLVGAIGVAICDGIDGLMFEMSKAFSGKELEPSEVFFEFKALVEGLDIALILGFKNISIFTDCSPLHQHLTGKKVEVPANVAKLVEQIKVGLRKFTQFHLYLVTPKEIKYAFEFARNAIALQHKLAAASSSTNNKTESCTICMEDTHVDQMFQITGCLHSYCFSCMMKHVQFKLLEGVLPKCPHDKCKSELKLDSCKMFLTPELFDIMSQRVKEASIPVEEKVYCPYPRCSAILSKTDLRRSMASSDIIVGSLGGRKCPRCSGVFCINCKIPWHEGMSCTDYKRRNPVPNEDIKLKSLATRNLWRHCPKCNHMISLDTGCYHIYCRCGHEFCYTCGAEWKNKKATCSCPIWDERNIRYDHA